MRPAASAGNIVQVIDQRGCVGAFALFDKEACKRIFQENPDRYLDAGGGVLPEPR